MIMIKRKSIVAGLMCATTLVSVGCGSNNFSSLPYVSSPTQYELYERFKDSVSSDSYTIRDAAYKYQEVVYIDIPSYIKTNVYALIDDIEAALSEDVYDSTTMDGIITENEFNFVKCQMDDRIYTRQGVEYQGYSSGVAVVDVIYTGKYKAQSPKTANTKYLGVNGVFIEDYKEPGKIIRDDTYIEKLNKEVIKKYIDDNMESGDFTLSELTNMANEYTSKFSDGHNVEMYNKVFGSSLSQIACMPDIEELIEVSSNNGKLGGYGIYNQGDDIAAGSGKSDYFSSATSKLTLRYVFSCNELRDTCELQKIVVKNYELDAKLPIEEAVVSEAVNKEISKVLDRADRAILNDDLGALASQKIFYNNRSAIYWGLYNKCTHITKRITSVDNFVGRQTSGGENRYFIIADTYSAERVRGDGEQVAVYNDKYWMLLTLSGETDEFVISDSVLVSRELVKEPENTSYDKYLNLIQALSVDGTITSETKKNLQEILNNLCSNMQNKDIDAINASIKRLNVVTSDYDLSKVVGQIESNIYARGKNKDIEVKQAVVNYITGNDVQVEAIVDEVIDYKDGYGMYNSIYMMFNREDDVWSIQEIRFIESERLSDVKDIEQRKQEIEAYSKKAN